MNQLIKKMFYPFNIKEKLKSNIKNILHKPYINLTTDQIFALMYTANEKDIISIKSALKS